MNEQFGHLFDYAVVLLNLGKSKEAIDKVEDFLKLKEDAAGGFLPYIRPLLIIAHLDLGNYELVPYLIKSTKAWMKRQKVSMHEADLFFSLTYAIAKATEPQRRQRWLMLQASVTEGKLENFTTEFGLKTWLGKKLAR